MTLATMRNDRLPPRPRRRTLRIAVTRPRILVTGFGPFPGVPFNASAALVESLAESSHSFHAAADIHATVLPTDWRDAPLQARGLIDAFKPEAVLHFGVSSRARNIQIETRAVNMRRSAADCSGGLPGGYYIEPGGPPVLPVTLPVRLMLHHLRLAGIPASLSRDAGRYLCNATLYGSLRHGARLANCLVGFVHIPALTAAHIVEEASGEQSMDFAELRRGASIILHTLARPMALRAQIR